MAWDQPSAGKLNKRIQFLRRDATDDGEGNEQGGWVNLGTPFSAALRPVNGREEVLASKLSGVQPYEIVVRQCAFTIGVTTEDAALNLRTNEHLNITAIQDPDQRGIWLSMLAKVGTAEG